jgi:hypothetical protein
VTPSRDEEAGRAAAQGADARPSPTPTPIPIPSADITTLFPSMAAGRDPANDDEDEDERAGGRGGWLAGWVLLKLSERREGGGGRKEISG